MGNRRRIQRLTVGLILVGAISHTNAQEQTTGSDVSPAPTQSVSSNDGASATTSISGSESSSTDVPLELWGIANGLLSSYYPSTTVSNVASLTWPSVVVIGSSTYTREPPTTSPTISPSTLATSAISSQDVSRPVATDSNTSNDAEPTDDPKEPESGSGQPKDRTLGIALGVVFGVLALGLMAFALLCIHHRQKKHGGKGLFPSRRRRAGSPTDSEIGAWRARHPHMSLVASAATGGSSMTQVRDNDDNYNTPLPPREWVKRYNRLEDQRTPPAHLHPAFMHRHNDSVGTTSESNPFFPAAEHQSPPQPNIGASHYDNERNEYHPGYPKSEPAFNNVITAYKPEEEEPTRRSQSSHNNERRRSSFSSERSDGDVDLERNSRPPTPFSPMMMLQTSLPPFQRQDHLQSQPQTQQQQMRQTQPLDQQPSHPQQHHRDHSNPFTSPSDPEEQRQQYQTLIPNHPHETNQEEDDDIVHPMLPNQPQNHSQPPPSKSPARRYSPMVHYPSWSEVSEFDFTGESSSSLAREQQLQRHHRRRSGGNGGEDGYGRDRESAVGRWELA